MSMLIAFMTGITSRLPGRGSDDSPKGATAVRTAVREIETHRETEFTAVLGEPDLVRNGGRYFPDTKVVVPIRDAPYDGANRLVFDLPRGSDQDSLFGDLLDVFGLDLDSMEDLEGETVPVEFIFGNCSILWDELPDTDKGSEDDEWTDEEIEAVAPADEEVYDSLNVSTEETTISADDSDEEEGDGSA